MTRMVEEDRMQIGTFKALGYAKGRIMSKYLIFCCLASLIGSVGGALIGFSLLPTIFWMAYGTMYTLPALEYGSACGSRSRCSSSPSPARRPSLGRRAARR